MRFFIVLFVGLVFNGVFAQEHAWVYFTDKPNEAAVMANPLLMLSQRALDRRVRQNINLDFKDVPLSNNYYNQIASQNGILVKAKSKWLNAVHVFGSVTDINALITLNFVNYIEFGDATLNNKPVNNSKINKFQNKFDDLTNYNYGGSYNQVNQIRVNFLHENNYTGNTMQIAVLDAGFPGVDTFSAFQQIRDNNQILGGYNYVDRIENFYQNFRHGTSVLSTIAGFVDGELIGTAPDAEFYLFITEDTNSETVLEESLWVEAAEKADSLGVDIINTSLGYRAFDEPRYNHLYSDLDGNTTFAARGANVAAERGIIVVVSAGNSGNTSFFNISTPADADNVFTIGAVDSNGVIAGFSSYGPNADNQIKPDVDAKGVQATVINANGNISTGNGTSYAAPIMAGAVACFWQAYPNKTNFEIMQLIRESAHLYNNPTNHEGYGIPNFENAFNTSNINNFYLDNVAVYPNPTKDKLIIKSTSNIDYIVNLFDVYGKRIVNIKNNEIDLSNFNGGVYFLKISNASNSKIIKIIKK